MNDIYSIYIFIFFTNNANFRVPSSSTGHKMDKKRHGDIAVVYKIFSHSEDFPELKPALTLK